MRITAGNRASRHNDDQLTSEIDHVGGAIQSGLTSRCRAGRSHKEDVDLDRYTANV